MLVDALTVDVESFLPDPVPGEEDAILVREVDELLRELALEAPAAALDALGDPAA